AAQLGSAGLRELGEVFLADTPALLEDLRRAAVAGSASDLARRAHALKGSCLTLGLERCSRLCEQLERAGREGRVEPELVSRVERELGWAEAALRQLIGADTRARASD